MGFTCGIVGLPNIGKSTIFNALTNAKAQSENFPFCTIEPNTGSVAVPDPRLIKLSELASSAKVIPTQITFVDIAGLIKGASKGEGLGNQFLGHIRSVDAIAHVVRCFDDENVVHVDGSISPLRDIETIETELLLSDIESVDKQKVKVQKLTKSGDKDAKKVYDYVCALLDHLNDGKPARSFEYEIDESLVKDIIQPLLSKKPVLYVCNVSEDDISRDFDLSGDSNHPMDIVAKYAQSVSAKYVCISGKVEAELSELESDEKEEYLKEYGIDSSGLDRLILAGYELLNLITFFTVGPKEAHAWTCKNGSFAPQAAGKIHSDFERGFIRAEVISYSDYVQFETEVKVKENGKLRVEGKEYLVQDGDVMHFRFNV